MIQHQPFILASQSPARLRLLKNVGLNPIIKPAEIDEREIERGLASKNQSAIELAEILSSEKSRSVACNNQPLITIGADQTLQFENQILHKPKDLDAAKDHLKKLRGKIHYLHSAIACHSGEQKLWSYTTTCSLEMRDFSDDFLDEYCDHCDDRILTSVGAYEIEAAGAQLFDRIDGDIFSIQGLPLLPLLEFLRCAKIMDT